MTNRGDFKAILAQNVGDANTSGSPNYTIGSGFKWSEPEYNSAINLAIDMMKRQHLVATTGSFGMTGGVSFTQAVVPGSMVLINSLRRNTEASGNLFERVIPMHIVSLRRDSANIPYLHFDVKAMRRFGLNVSGAAVNAKGYRHASKPAADGSGIEINEAALLLMSRMFLSQGGIARDPAELLKNMRQIEQTRQIIDQMEGLTTPIGEYDGLWVEEI